MCCLPPKPIASSRIHKARSASSSGLHDSQRHIVVQHDYKDHAKDSPPVLDSILHSLVQATSASASFPFKLYDMLQRVEEDGNAHIISFQPHGRCMVIHKPERLVELLPTYFNLSKLPSFQRQLNLYGFRRLTKGADRGGYYNEYFLRGKPFLIPRIHRLKVKGTGVRARSNPDQEPDFWSMPWVGASTNTLAAPTTSTSMAAIEIQRSSYESKDVMKSSASIVSTDENDLDVDGCADAFPTKSTDSRDCCGGILNCDCEPIPVTTQSFEFRQPSKYEENMELTAWGKTFHFMGDIDLETSLKKSPAEINSTKVKSERRQSRLMNVFDEVDDSYV